MSKRKPRKKQQPTIQKRPLWVTVVVIFLAAAVLVSLIWKAIPTTTQNEADLALAFKKEGSLTFLRDTLQQTIVEIDIEVAATDAEQQRGLMYRRSMEENQGMLFIFPASERRSFWMLNTYLSLDILFVDADFTIVDIKTNTTPLSQAQLTSKANAQYVVEVLAGFVGKHNIQIGDKIQFSLED